MLLLIDHNSLRHQAPMKKTSLHECTTKKQKPMQTSWTFVGARSKLRSKVIFWPISRLINFVRQHQNTAKHVASGKLTIPLTKQAEKSLGSIGLVF